MAKYFIKEYKKYHRLSDKEIKLMPDITTAGAIEDFSYVYYTFENDPKRAKVYKLKLYSKIAQWFNENKERIIKEII